LQKAVTRGADVAVAKGEWLPFRDHFFDVLFPLSASESVPSCELLVF